jgi:transaldolase
MIGEKATLASQKCVAEISAKRIFPTLQIAASLRDASQVAALAGVDVFTMPVKVADSARRQLDGMWESKREYACETTLGDGIDPKQVRIEKLWEISDNERALAESLDSDEPHSAIDFAERCYSFGIEDLFPRVTQNEIWVLSREGKIPKHDTWKAKVEREELAIDSILNLAALESFSADQKALDDRIRGLIQA